MCINTEFKDQDINNMSLLLMLGHSISYTYNTTVNEWTRLLPEIHKNTYILRYKYLYMTLGCQGIKKYVVDFIKDKKIDIVLFLDCTLTTEFEITFLEELRKSVYTVIYFGDIIIYFDDRFRYQAQAFDLVLVDEYCEKYKVQLYGFETLFVPYCFDLNLYKNLSMRRDIEVSFIGRQDRIGRREYLTFLKKNNIGLQLFGVGTENGPVSQKEMIEIFNRSKINLNFTGIAEYQFNKYAQPIDKRVKSVKGRCQEIALTKSFVLTEDAPGMEKSFDIGTEIDIFRDEEELLQKIIYYLDNEEIRENMAAKSYERALINYDSTKVWNNVLKIICNRANKKRYIPSKIYLDDNYLKSISKHRAINVINFVRQKKLNLAFEELKLVLRSRKINIVETLIAVMKEILRPLLKNQ